MAWREILTFADATEDGVARARVAKTIAEKHGAHLQVDVVTRLPAPPYGPGADLVGRIYADALAPVRKAAAEAVTALRALWPNEGDMVSVTERDCFFNDTRAFAAQAARIADLTVLARPENIDKSDLDSELFLGALFGGGRPCLALPRWTKPQDLGRRVLIAWKGTAEAARAVQGALPLIAEAEAVRVDIANPRGAREGEDMAGLDRLVGYLSRHGAKVEPPVVLESRENAEKMLPSEIEAFKADLLVMGAYSRPRLQEIVFGGMTAAMVREARIPIFLAH